VFHFSVKSVKYPFYLFGVILFSKIGYVVIESYYNFHVLSVTTDPSLTKDALEELNRNGHRISAVGITLLLIPFLYLIVKKLPQIKMLIMLCILSVTTYLLSYEALNTIVDKIVETNKDKRHDAYYVDILKYGILNNIFVYDSFVDSNRTKENNFTVDDKILLTNIFLLLYADKKVIDKLKERGKDAVVDLYIQRNLQEDYDKKYMQYVDASKEIEKNWNSFNQNRKKLKYDLSELKDENYIRESYNKMTKNLSNNYKKYEEVWGKVGECIREETRMWKISEIQKELKKYFMFQRYKNAQDRYKDEMNKRFGHFIEPIRWKDKNNNVTQEKIITVIKEDIIEKSRAKVGKLPRGLKFKEFIYHDETKRKVRKELKKQDILIPYDFDYSYKQFRRYFNIMASKKHNESFSKFYEELKKEIGSNDLKLSMVWKEYIYSDFIKKQIEKKLKLEKPEDLKNILKSLYSKDLGNFKRFVYLPPIKEKIEEQRYSKNDFHDGNKAEQDGDDAIKLLYIPPFALAVSIIALLLNILTVLSMILMLFTKYSSLKIRSIQFLSMLLLIILPFIFGSNTFINNEIISQIESESIQSYLKFLEWINFYEKINYPLH